MISDKPRFKFRSILVDTARHFIPLEVLMRHVVRICDSQNDIDHFYIKLSYRRSWHITSLMYYTGILLMINRFLIRVTHFLN